MAERTTNLATGASSSGSSVDLHQETFENSTHVTELEPKGWSYPEGHHHQRQKVDKTFRSNNLTKVNGVEAFSKASSLYKGTGGLGEFWVDPKVDPNTGKVPKQQWIEFDYPTYRGPREEIGLEDNPIRPRVGKHPAISPEVSGLQDTTVSSEAIHTTWRDLRDQLGVGMGVRTNKFLLELTLPLYDGIHPWKLNILCKATSFPTRSMTTASMWRFGRKYNLRGETNFGDTWTLTFEDDSSLSLRKKFDYWFKEIDDSKLQHTALNNWQNYGDPAKRLETKTVHLFEREETAKFDLGNTLRGAWNTLTHPEYQASAPNYQTDIRVYQLDQTGNKVMGYVMQNAFVSEIGAVEYGDDKQNELVTYPVTFTFSEFLPLSGNMLDEKIRVFK